MRRMNCPSAAAAACRSGASMVARSGAHRGDETVDSLRARVEKNFRPFGAGQRQLGRDQLRRAEAKDQIAACVAIAQHVLQRGGGIFGELGEKRERQLVVGRAILDCSQRLLREALVAQPILQPFGQDRELRGCGRAWHHITITDATHACAAIDGPPRGRSTCEANLVKQRRGNLTPSFRAHVGQGTGHEERALRFIPYVVEFSVGCGRVALFRQKTFLARSWRIREHAIVMTPFPSWKRIWNKRRRALPRGKGNRIRRKGCW